MSTSALGQDFIAKCNIIKCVRSLISYILNIAQCDLLTQKSATTTCIYMHPCTHAHAHTHEHPIAHQDVPYEHPIAYQDVPYEHPIAHQDVPYEHPIAYQAMSLCAVKSHVLKIISSMHNYKTILEALKGSH